MIPAPEELTPKERAVHEVLAEWHDAISNGTAYARLPSLTHSYRKGEPPTEEALANLFTWLDAYTWNQNGWVKLNRGIVADAGPDFSGLPPEAQLALFQDLDTVLAQYPNEHPDMPEFVG